MSLWRPQPAQQQPQYDTQHSLPPPPNLLPASSHRPLPVTLPALPPPQAPTSLDAARLRLTLERVKLELDGAREALGEVLALREAVEALREEFRLGEAQREAQGGWNSRFRPTEYD